MSCYFIAGTDTDCGKTQITLALLAYFQRQNLTTLGLKPIAAGINQYHKNDDAEQLNQASSIILDYKTTNPYLFNEPISPHIAAANEGKNINLNDLKDWLKPLKEKANMVLVEGAGGWYAPISDENTMADIVIQNQLPVILVVGLKLGCLNHALLTVEAIQNTGCQLMGWIGNQLDPDMNALNQNILTLKRCIHADCFGIIPYQQQMQTMTISYLFNRHKIRRLIK